MAVQFEDPVTAIEAFAVAGIQICKFQISSALRISFCEGDGRAEELLSRFAEPTYLHQVVERSQNGLARYTDLPDGLAVERVAHNRGRVGPAKEWRVHFHVPIFLSEMQGFETTQNHLTALLALLGSNPVAACLEVETYTWGRVAGRVPDRRHGDCHSPGACMGA